MNGHDLITFGLFSLLKPTATMLSVMFWARK